MTARPWRVKHGNNESISRLFLTTMVHDLGEIRLRCYLGHWHTQHSSPIIKLLGGRSLANILIFNVTQPYMSAIKISGKMYASTKMLGVPQKFV